MRHEFSEVLNDGVDYFLLGDIQLLERFKQDQQLPDDLAYAFTHDDSGDQAVREGVVLPLAGVDNLPYRILFTLDNHTPALREAGSRLKHQRNGYVLRVEHGALMLYTWRILQHFTPKTLGDFLARYRYRGGRSSSWTMAGMTWRCWPAQWCATPCTSQRSSSC